MMKIAFAANVPSDAALVAYAVAKGSVDAVPAAVQALAAAAAVTATMLAMSAQAVR
jgi:hypothetical protein